MAGLRIITPEEMTRPHMIAVADALARYIRRRQLSDGLFAYEFLPGRDMYWPAARQHWVRQAATAWALAGYAGNRRDRAGLESRYVGQRDDAGIQTAHGGGCR